MGSSQSRTLRDRTPRAADSQRTPPRTSGVRRDREDSEEQAPSDAPAEPFDPQYFIPAERPYARRRRLSLGRSLGLRPRTPSASALPARAEPRPPPLPAPHPLAAVLPRPFRAGWGRSTSAAPANAAAARPGVAAGGAHEPLPPTPYPQDGTVPPPAAALPLAPPRADADPLMPERAETMRLIERVLGHRGRRRAGPTEPASAAAAEAPSVPAPAPAPHPPLDPTILSGQGTRTRQGPAARMRWNRDAGYSPPRPTTALGSLLSEVLGMPRAGNAAPSAPLSGTSVIVQGALVARTASREGGAEDGGARGAEGGDAAAGERGGDAAAGGAGGDAAATADANASAAQPGLGLPQVASLEEQGEMLGRILRIATAATAASLVNSPPSSAPATPAANAPGNAHLGSDLLERLAMLSQRMRTGGERRAARAGAEEPHAAPHAPDDEPHDTAHASGVEAEERHRGSDVGGVGAREGAPHLRFPGGAPQSRPAFDPQARAGEETVSTITRLMRETLRSSTAPRTEPQAGDADAAQSPAASVMATLDQARQGHPLREGEPDSFERFLHDLLIDLSAAVLRIDHGAASRPLSERRANDADNSEDPALRARREGDLSCGQLSFFRLFRFERHADTSLIPCVLVGVRSLQADERLMGQDEDAGAGAHTPSAPRGTDGAAQPDAAHRSAGTPPGAAQHAAGTQPDAADRTAGTSRFILFVSGGRYEEDHALLTARPRDAGRDLMFMMELLGTMAAMGSKPQTASAADIARSGLVKCKARELPGYLAQGKATENTTEKCLVCLEEWEPEDDCRLLMCHHAFHAACVDKWLEQSSNSCPLCRTKAVHVAL
ncbi:hypothetical protein MSPP1_003304 [Malassezia sp. CBS 17886]|nr:hypothetical protein MSPP1_003304 [Malassezia sp. CBS 17886]